MAQVSIVMGSDSDMPVMAKAADILEELGISYEMTIISAHREPDVFFDYAKTAEDKGFKVFLTRSTDIFIPLRRRVDIARKYHADLFISIHADSTVNRKAQGFSIYTLSEKASDKEAEALAERENKADIIDGMDFSDNSPEINDVLISLSQNDSRNKSSKFATYVVNEVKRNVKLVSNAHKFAGFAVYV